MTDLYRRILLWHKLVAMQTGGLALCSSRHRLNRDEATGWATALENVAADMRQFLSDGTFILDDKGQRVVRSGVESERPSNRQQEARHVARSEEGNPVNPSAATGPTRAGGRRIATRKKI